MTREAIRFVEKTDGFNLNENINVSAVYSLFFAALRKNHPNVNRPKADKMLDELTTPDENGEIMYGFDEIANALGEITKPCFATTEVVPKKSIKMI
jgi:hypothetical protein